MHTWQFFLSFYSLAVFSIPSSSWKMLKCFGKKLLALYLLSVQGTAVFLCSIWVLGFIDLLIKAACRDVRISTVITWPLLFGISLWFPVFSMNHSLDLHLKCSRTFCWHSGVYKPDETASGQRAVVENWPHLPKSELTTSPGFIMHDSSVWNMET